MRPAWRGPSRSRRLGRGLWGLGLAAVAAVWIWAGPALSRVVHGGGGGRGRPVLSATGPSASTTVCGDSTARPSRPARGQVAGPAAAGHAGAAARGGAGAAGRPDHIAASVRWAGAGPELLYNSSLVPYRAFEWIWPNVFGTFTAGNRYWIPILPPAGAEHPSPLSLYAGALPIVLALGDGGFKGGPPWRAWMTAVATAEPLGEPGRIRRAVGLVRRSPHLRRRRR